MKWTVWLRSSPVLPWRRWHAYASRLAAEGMAERLRLLPGCADAVVRPAA